MPSAMIEPEMNTLVAKRSKLPIFATVCWLAMWAIGMSVYSGIKTRNVVGFPNSGQLGLYVLIPAGMAVFNILLLALSPKLPRALVIALVLIQALPLFIVFMLFGGGV